MRRDLACVDNQGMSARGRQSILRTTAKTTLAVAITALAVAPAASAEARGGHPARSSQAACPNADHATSDTRELQKGMLCLHNFDRRERGLSQMRWSSELARVAEAHASDMVARRYFAHVGPGGRDHMDRVASSGYRPAAGCWTASENLVLSSARSSSRRLMRVWMHSPAHRENVLRPGWQDFGLGVAGMSPTGNPNGVTLVALFGTRSKQLCG
jgi:uncharacterized protein YkwD